MTEDQRLILDTVEQANEQIVRAELFLALAQQLTGWAPSQDSENV